jgi:hypothetical protein
MRVRNSRAALLSDYEVLTVMREMNENMQGAATMSSLNPPATATNTDPIVNGSGSALVNGGEQNSNSNNVNKTYDSLDQEEDRLYKSIPSNLRSIQYKVLETLSSVQRPCAHQDAKKMSIFMDAIAAWERGRPIEGMAKERYSQAPIAKEVRLTKGEKLMLINHAPKELVVLYAVSVEKTSRDIGSLFTILTGFILMVLSSTQIVEETHERFTQEEQYDLLSIISEILPLDEMTMDKDLEMTAAEGAANPVKADIEHDENGVEAKTTKRKG